jgi:hypothetical protein
MIYFLKKEYASLSRRQLFLIDVMYRFAVEQTTGSAYITRGEDSRHAFASVRIENHDGRLDYFN